MFEVTHCGKRTKCLDHVVLRSSQQVTKQEAVWIQWQFEFVTSCLRESLMFVLCSNTSYTLEKKKNISCWIMKTFVCATVSRSLSS